jgi:hypothetical protein
VLAGLLLLAMPAFGQAPDESALAAARLMGQQGVALYGQGDYAGASERLESAYSVVHVPTLGLWAGRALEKLGKLVEASQRYREVLLFAVTPRDPEVFRTAQADAQQAFDALAGRIAQLSIELVGATAREVSFAIDGKAVPSALTAYALPVNPGTRKLEARRGQQVVSQAVTLREGEKRTVTLTFVAESAAPTVAAAAPTPKQVAAQQHTSADGDDAALTAAEAGEDDARPSKPLTKQWWFWTGLGGVVLGGTAVALALALGGGDGGTAPPLAGSAGQATGP